MGKRVTVLKIETEKIITDDCYPVNIFDYDTEMSKVYEIMNIRKMAYVSNDIKNKDSFRGISDYLVNECGFDPEYKWSSEYPDTKSKDQLFCQDLFFAICRDDISDTLFDLLNGRSDYVSSLQNELIELRYLKYRPFKNLWEWVIRKIKSFFGA